jgi:hypothetical protein
LLGAAVAALLVGVLAFGPLVRARVTSEGARRGFVVKAGRAVPGWFSVRLSDVEVELEGVKGVRVTVPELRVGLDVFLRPREIDVLGAAVTMEGSAEELADAFAAWRSRRPPAAASTEGKGSGLQARAESCAFTWKADASPAADAIEASGISIVKDEQGTKVGFDRLRATRHELSAEVSSATAEVTRAGTIKNAKAGTVDLVYRTKAEEKQGADQTAPIEPPPLPLVVANGKKGAKGQPVVAAPAPAESTEPLLPLPDLHVLRARAALLAKTLAARLEDDSSVAIDGLAFHFERAGAQPLTLGPGACTLARHANGVEIEYSTAPASKGAALAIEGKLPTGDSGDVRVSISGGPVALSLLGVKEGGGGLVDVDRATVTGKGSVVLAGAGDALTFDGDFALQHFGIHQPRLALEPLHGLEVSARARGLLTDKGELRLDDAEAALGSLKLRTHGNLEQSSDHTAGAFSFDIPVASCQSLLDSVPGALLPELRGAQMTGTLGGKGRFIFDSKKLDDLTLSYDVDDLCKLTLVPAPLAKERFQKPFMHRIYTPDGKQSEEETGPGTDKWIVLDGVSPYMQVAVLTTEDGAFFHHRGFNHGAIKSSLIANLKARRFVRGASTITMQTAKNLFLTRDKTLGRKLEELILTDYLEQTFTKSEILEVYFNIIEFGPNLYGIVSASEHYFGRKPEELNIAECLFLASLLPRPVGFHKLYEKGELSESWMKNLHTLMEIAFKNGKLSESELRDGLAQPIVFYKPESPRPPPRPAIPGSHFTGDDQDWRQLN